MAAVPVNYRDVQFRTLGHTYRFQAESKAVGAPYSFWTKVYNMDRGLVYSNERAVSEGEVRDFFSAERGNQLLEGAVRRGWIPAEHVDTARPQNLGTLKKIIDVAKTRIPMEGLDVEKFVCPISLEVFVDPVLDSCGHTFERKWIEEALTRKDTCPLSRQLVHSLTPIHQLREAIAEWRKRDPIPTFSLFKMANAVLAGKNLETAQAHMEQMGTDEESYDGALQSYSAAFRYTNDWHEYAALPLLFVKKGHLEKAQLAYLYLAQYQIEAGATNEAIASFRAYKDLNPPLSVDACLAELYQSVGKTGEAVDLVLQAATACAAGAADPALAKQALALYKQAVSYDPYRWEAYHQMAHLLESPLERAHMLLRGACHALERKESEEAVRLCRLAEASNNDFFVDRLMDLDLWRSGVSHPEDRELHSVKEKLLALAQDYETRNLSGEMVKAYKMLSYLEYNPVYYEKLIDGYKSLGKKDQVLSWATRWISLLIEKQEWERAEGVAQKTLEQLGPRISLYENLETIYTHWNEHKLCDLWGQLGKAHRDNQQLELAERVYQKAFDKFHAAKQAMDLADLQRAMGKTPQSVRNYYEAGSASLVEENVDVLNLCVRNIRQIDPKMQHLDPVQRMHMLTQASLFRLQEELSSATKRIAALEAPRFGASVWAQYFGDVGVEPPLPHDIETVLSGPCPIWPGKRVKDTHMLVLIPQTVNGVPFTLNALGELVKAPREGGNPTQFNEANSWKPALDEHGPKPAPASHWVLMTRQSLPNSTNKTYQQQCDLVAGLGAPYEVPHLLDAVTCVLLERVRTGAFLYEKDPSWVRVQEQTKGGRLIFGAFAASGLRVHFILDDLDYDYVGVSGLRKF